MMSPCRGTYRGWGDLEGWGTFNSFPPRIEREGRRGFRGTVLSGFPTSLYVPFAMSNHAVGGLGGQKLQILVFN